MHSRFQNYLITAFWFYCYVCFLTSRGDWPCPHPSWHLKCQQLDLTQSVDTGKDLSIDPIVATVVGFLDVINGVNFHFHTRITGVWSIVGIEMVVEYKGFRSRWKSHACSSSLPVSSDQLESSSLPDLDFSWEQFDSVDTGGLFGDANETFDFQDDPDLKHDTDQPDNIVHRFVEPKPKVAPSKPVAPTSDSLAIKRTADELASRHVHRSILDVKQPWQKGPLAGMFGKQKPFWERLQVTKSVPVVGLLDHVVASSASSEIPRPIQQTELTVNRIRSSRIIASDDNYRHLSLSRFKTMVLLDLDCTRLGQSLRSFAGTLCTDDELSQAFMDVFAPKATGTILKRCNALWRFSCWLQRWGSFSPFNQDEGVIYEYICHLRNSGAGSTTPSDEICRHTSGLLSDLAKGHAESSSRGGSARLLHDQEGEETCRSLEGC